MALVDQVDRLVTAGVAEAAGISAHQFRAQAAELPDVPDGILAVHPALVPASRLAPLLRHAGRAGFVVEDMTDVDAFAPIDTVTVPDLPVYVVYSPVRGDEMRNWSPDEALPAIHAAGRTPLTLAEGISWLLQEPAVLLAGSCFMTIGSRKQSGPGVDPRAPAIWISRGTGRDGPQRRNAPKVGWCWAANRHTWLGHASASHRTPGGLPRKAP